MWKCTHPLSTNRAAAAAKTFRPFHQWWYESPASANRSFYLFLHSITLSDWPLTWEIVVSYHPAVQPPSWQQCQRRSVPPHTFTGLWSDREAREQRRNQTESGSARVHMMDWPFWPCSMVLLLLTQLLQHCSLLERKEEWSIPKILFESDKKSFILI